MKILLFFFVVLFAFLGISVTAQKINRDSAMYYTNTLHDKSKAIAFINAYLSDMEKSKSDSLYVSAINDQSYIYGRYSEFEKADKILDKAISECIIKLGKSNILYAKMLSNKAAMVYRSEKFDLARQLLEESETIFESINQTNNNVYSIVINNLGSIHDKLGNKKKAEHYIYKGIALSKQQFGDTARQYAFALNGLASYLQEIANYRESKSNFIKAISVLEKIGDTLSNDYADFIGNLGAVCQDLKEYSAAERYLRKSAMIVKQTYGDSSLDYATSLESLGSLFLLNKKLTEAEPLLKFSLEKKQKLLGENNFDYLNILRRVAELYILQKKYFEAKVMLDIGDSIFIKNIGTENKYYLFSLFNLCRVDYFLGDTLSLGIHILEEQKIAKKLVLNNLDLFTNSEMIEYVNNRAVYGNAIYSYAMKVASNQVKEAAYNNSLFYKGIGVSNCATLTNAIETITDTSLKETVNLFKSTRKILNKILQQPIIKRKISIDSVETSLKSLEKNLIKGFQPFKELHENNNREWKEVRKMLSKNEAAIEFVEMNTLSLVNSQSSKGYAALLIRQKDSVPVVINLCGEDELISALKNFSYKGKFSIAPGIVSARKNIYSVIWQPLEKYLNNITTIYFSPDGLLHQLAFTAIVKPNDQLLSDRYKLIQLISTRDIFNTKEEKSKTSSAVLFGGIDYNLQAINHTNNINPDAYSFAYQQNNRGLADSFVYLNYTLPEVQNVGAKLNAKGVKTYLFRSEVASESNFKWVCDSLKPSIIHIATHGFTLPDTTSFNDINNIYTSSKNPMLRTGLVMAGGNNGWKARNKDDEDDGILTGMEIASMQLPNTQLVVLSACETANGEIQGSEGVFGLQRAFKLAGVKYVMASLWQVPDLQTKEFMDIFYSNWMQNLTIQDAFNRTQQTMHKKYAPYYWGGFTLIH